MGGGGQPGIPDVSPASLSSIANEAVSSNISNLPRILQAFAQYGPQYASSIADIFINQQKRLKEAYPEKYATLQGYSSNLNTALKAIGEAGGMGLPSTLLAPLQDYTRGAQAARGMAQSPISALAEAQAFGGLGEQYRESISAEAQDFLNSTNLEVPGGRQSLETTGLTPISMTDLFQGGISQDNNRVNNAYAQYALRQQRNNANAGLWGMGGSGLGMAAGLGLSMIPGLNLAAIPAMMAGGALGGGAGMMAGTYF